MDLNADKQTCLDSLASSFSGLQVNAAIEQLEPIAELIIQSMTGPWRSFHTPDHIFQVGLGGDEIEVIAALFHDMIYVQVDQGINVNMARYISPFIKEVNGQLIISTDAELAKDPLFKLCLAIFGFEQGRQLNPMAGQNEFLSALLAVKVFDGLLPTPILAQIAACIEATIPFRGPNADGVSCSDKLLTQLQQVNQEFAFNWTDPEMIAMVERGVRLSNRDVENFSSEHAAHFLDNTWNLIPETNHDLMRVNTYTANGYRISLQKMEGFLNFLKAEIVFRQFQSEPSPARFELLVTRAKRNLEIARLYLGMKLTSIAVLEAISLRIGRDVSVAMLMGELPQDNLPVMGLQDFLPKVEKPVITTNPNELEVLSLLELGRTFDSEYDVKNSPIATFMVKTLGFEHMQAILLKARAFFKGELTAEAFLECCPKDLVDDIVASILKLFDERRAALLYS
jgi:hypothetical protein